MREYQLLIDGQWVPAEDGETFESVNPFTGQPVTRCPRGKKADIDRAVTAARKAFDEGPWPHMSGEERGAVLEQIAAKIEEKGRELGGLIIEESGSTLRKVKGEVFLSAKHMNYFAKLARQQHEETLERLSRPGVSKNIVVHEPIGVCGQITPWNFPLQMLIWKLGPALAAGNTVVLKPAEETPGVAMALAEILMETDLPPGVVNIVTGYGEEAGAPLVGHPGVDKVAFTGSTEVGKKIMGTAAQGLKPVTLELGGKSANIVFDDADLDIAVDGSLYAVFFHSGQCCTAGSRLFVQAGIYDEFVARLLEKARAIKLGNPADKTTDLGPLVSKKQQERVLQYIENAKQEGAHCVLGGELPRDGELAQGYFVQPTIFAEVTNEMAIAREEVFGPVLSIIRFKTAEEAIRQANDSPYGLAGGVWSRDEQKAMEVARKLRTGTVWVNDYHLISEKAPFGGYKQSGLGRELGEQALAAYTETKHIHMDELKERGKKFWYDAVVPAPVPTAGGS